MLGTIGRDLRFARRSLRRTPTLTIAAVLSIGLGIAATTAVFSIVDAALFRPPPLPGADRLAILFITRQRANAPPERERWSWPRTRLLRQQATAFEQIASFSLSVLTLTSGEPEPVNGEMISSSYWPALGVQPVIGRAFALEEDEGAGAHPVAMLAYDLWQRRFGGDASILGRTISLNGVSVAVIGVLPPGFTGMSGRSQLWLPATMAPRLSYADYLTTNQNFISVVGRLRDGVTLETARAQLEIVGEAIHRALPSATSLSDVRFAATAMPLSEARIDPTTRRPLLLLLAAAGCLLLLSCVAGLLLGRAVARRREIAIRIATGASRGRIVRQLLVEAGVLAAGGGALGLLVTLPLANELVIPPAMSRWRNFYGAVGEFATPQVDARALAFCLTLCALTTVVFGLVPALRATRVDLTRDLKDGSMTGGTSSRSTARQFIVGLETALAVVLLFGGGLLLAGWRRLSAVDVGFDRTHLLTFLIRASEVQYPPQKAPALIDRVLAEIERVPDVEAASVDGCAPVGSGCANSTLYIMGRPQPAPGTAPGVLRHYVGPHHFQTLKVPVIRGRVFDSGDRAGGRRVAVISQTAARRFWPSEDPIGHRVWFGSSSFDRPDSSAEIVGIVGDVAYQQLEDHPFQPDFYTPYTQFTYASRTVLVRTRRNPSAVVGDLRRAVRAADPNLALFEVRTMEERTADYWARLTYQMRLLGAFAVVALALAATGIFAVIAHAVSDRRREIGVRVALGATPAQVIATVGDRGARPALIGLAFGLVAAMMLGRVVASAVYGVRALDAPVLAAVVSMTIVVTIVATYLAARRALAVEPAEALRAQ